MANRQPVPPKRIALRGLCQRWDCSAMFVERQIRNNPNFPKYAQLGVGPMAQRTWDIEEIEAYERSRVVARSA
jgi:hypothetical protein